MLIDENVVPAGFNVVVVI